MGNLFDLLPENLFTLFSGTNKRIYADILLLLYKESSFSTAFEYDRKDVITLISDYFKNGVEVDFYDEETNKHIKDNQKKASEVVRNLKKYGWLSEEQGSNYTRILHLEDYAIEFLKVFDKLNSEYTVEYSGYIYGIYHSLMNFDLYRGDIIIEKAFIDTETLLNKLKSLNANIRKYIQRLMKLDREQNLHDLMDHFLVDYQVNVIDQAYFNLKTKDHPSKYRETILRKLKQFLRDDYRTTIAKSIAHTKNITMEEAEELLRRQIFFIQESFIHLDEIIEEIDDKHKRYIQSAISKITFLLNEEVDLEGNIYAVLKELQSGKEACIKQCFPLYPYQYLSEDPLYMPRSKLMVEKSRKAETRRSLNEEEREMMQARFLAHREFSKSSIKHYLDELMEGRQSLRASCFPLRNHREFTKMMLVYMYGTHKDFGYDILRMQEVVRVFDFEFQEFEVRRCS